MAKRGAAARGDIAAARRDHDRGWRRARAQRPCERAHRAARARVRRGGEAAHPDWAARGDARRGRPAHCIRGLQETRGRPHACTPYRRLACALLTWRQDAGGARMGSGAIQGRASTIACRDRCRTTRLGHQRRALRHQLRLPSVRRGVRASDRPHGPRWLGRLGVYTRHLRGRTRSRRARPRAQRLGAASAA